MFQSVSNPRANTKKLGFNIVEDQLMKISPQADKMLTLLLIHTFYYIV